MFQTFQTNAPFSRMHKTILYLIFFRKKKQIQHDVLTQKKTSNAFQIFYFFPLHFSYKIQLIEEIQMVFFFSFTLLKWEHVHIVHCVQSTLPES